ncbi:hypothetical protein C6Y14_19960 [Streptomyces dioscori]|uniref:Uncharacterized protein n=1 Tax=Streptomyces dioscori TaxID=2109333 RepID=A0A2P8Q5P9_9ACTN|nr:hypothetical protein C6Y14_19960 [Streptomyces dioscori]
MEEDIRTAGDGVGEEAGDEAGDSFDGSGGGVGAAMFRIIRTYGGARPSLWTTGPRLREEALT